MNNNGIFESVRFIDQSQFNIYIECDLVEFDESLNESIILKFIKKKDVPEDFKKEALKICQTIQDESGKKGVEGVLGTSFK